MFSFALRSLRFAEWRAWLPPAVLAAMFVSLFALGGDRWHFYREGGLHDHNTAQTLALAENFSPAHNFRLASHIQTGADGAVRYDFYSRFPIGGVAVVKPAIMPFGDDLAGRLAASRVLAMAMFCGAALAVYLAITRIAGNRWVALGAVALGFSGYYALYYADGGFNEGVMDVFGAALAFHGMTAFVQEGRFRQLLLKTCAAIFLGWHVYGLLLPFIAIGFGGEAVAALRTAASARAGDRARATRAAIAALVRSRYIALAAVAILWGFALVAFNLANEYTAYPESGGGLADTPLFGSIAKRLGQDEGYNEQEPGLAWDVFLRRQLYRAGAAVVPYAAARAVGLEFPISEPWLVDWGPAVLGFAAACAALGALFAVRRRRILMASAALFGFCYAIPMRFATFHRWHGFDALPYMGLALALFAVALAGAVVLARRRLGERGAERVAIGIGAAAAVVFALSVFHAGRGERDANQAEVNKASMSELSEIRRIAGGKPAAMVSNYHESWAEVANWYWSKRMRFYRAGSSIERASPCDERVLDFTISRYRDGGMNPLTPDNRIAFLYADTSPLELCRAERRGLESSEPSARAAFDVYLREGALSYLKSPCDESDYTAPFFAYAYPADLRDLPAERRRDGFHPWSAIELEARGGAFDGVCMMTLRLPPYPIAGARTGQYDAAGGGGRLWDVFIAAPIEGETLAAYERLYREIAEGGEPDARGDFDVYLRGDTLAYLKEPCGEGDARGRFFLSVYPADAGDLPAERRESGHESLNFDFAPPTGAVFNGKCMATRALPDYEIERIETGQWVPGGERLWSAEIGAGD